MKKMMAVLACVLGIMGAPCVAADAPARGSVPSADELAEYTAEERERDAFSQAFQDLLVVNTEVALSVEAPRGPEIIITITRVDGGKIVLMEDHVKGDRKLCSYLNESGKSISDVIAGIVGQSIVNTLSPGSLPEFVFKDGVLFAKIPGHESRRLFIFSIEKTAKDE